MKNRIILKVLVRLFLTGIECQTSMGVRGSQGIAKKQEYPRMIKAIVVNVSRE